MIEKYSVTDTAPLEFTYEFLNDPDQRTLLAEAVDELVQKVNQAETEVVVFLDKSARPLSTLFMDLWTKRYPNQQRPGIHFLNVGKEISVNTEEYYKPLHVGDEDYAEQMDTISSPEDAERILGIEPEAIEEVREKYTDLAQLDQESKEFDKKAKVLIVDEYSITGESLGLAKTILGTAFTNLNITTHSLSEDGGKLFAKKHETYNIMSYNPPWRFHEGEANYGVTGVVNPAVEAGRKHRFTADRTDSSQEHSEEHNSRLQEELQHALEEEEQDIYEACKQLPTLLTELDAIKVEGELAERIRVIRGTAEQLGVLGNKILQEKENSEDLKRELYQELARIQELVDSSSETYMANYVARVELQGLTRNDPAITSFRRAQHFQKKQGHIQDELQQLQTPLSARIQQLRSEMHEVANEYWEMVDKKMAA